MKRKILVVDDDQGILEVVRNRLEANNYEVITANNGEEALNTARSERPNMIVLDIMMPIVGGYEACMRLKQDKDLCHIPVIILTARIKYTNKKIAEQCGANAYIPKPYSSDMLLEEIKKFI